MKMERRKVFCGTSLNHMFFLLKSSRDLGQETVLDEL